MRIADIEAETTAHIAKRLREARAGSRWIEGDLAAAIGLGQVAISLWEAGLRRPGIAELRGLADALDKPLDYFLDFPSGEGETNG